MKKLLFISSYDSTFVKSDIGILKNHFQVEIPNLVNSKRDIFDLMKNTIRIFWGVFRNDIVFCWFADFSAFLAVKAANFFHKEVFVVVGGYEVSNLPGYGGLTDEKRVARLKYTLSKVTKVIAISDFSKTEIDELDLGIKPKKISIGVESQEISFSKANTIITSGSATSGLYKLKGLDVFAEATKNIPDYQIKLIGQFDDEIKEKLLSINPLLEFIGKLTHIQFLKELNEAKVYCQLSQRESFGLALLEAMSFGCIPVISKAGAMPELVDDNGFICEYGDVESTKFAIQQAIKSENQDEIMNRVKEKYSLQQREEKLIELIKQEL